MLAETRERVAAKGVTLELGPRLMERLVSDGYSHEYGARPLRQVRRARTRVPAGAPAAWLAGRLAAALAAPRMQARAG